MRHAFTFLLVFCFCLIGCTNHIETEDTFVPDIQLMALLPSSPDNIGAIDSTEVLAMLRSYQFGVLPLTPDTPVNQYLPTGMEVSVNSFGKVGGTVMITAGYPKEERRTMKDIFVTSLGDAYQIPADHFSVERKAIDISHVQYDICVKENQTGKDMVYYIEISDYGTKDDGRHYYNKALIVIEQAAL